MRQIPRMERVELMGTGHALHHSHPERIAGLIASFSRRLGATEPQAAPSQNQGAESETSVQLDQAVGAG